LSIVCKKLVTELEESYINYIKDYLGSINMKMFIEHNNILIDYYIMKESKLLICSNITLSWFGIFSDKIQKCYLPDYIETANTSCKYPIDNAELY
jgi:hypothetical protein